LLADTQEQQRSELTPAEVGRGLRLLLWDAGLSTVKVTLTLGAFLAGFALWLGANERQIGLIMALPSLGQAAQLFAPRILQKVRSRRRFAGWYYGAGESAWILIILLALTTPALISKETALWLFVACLATEGILMAVAMPAGISLMSDIIPAHRRGRFIGKRNMLMAAVGIGVSLLGGVLLDYVGEPKGFALIYVIGYLCGMGGVLCVAILPEREQAPAEKPLPLLRLWLDAWRNPAFREFLLFMSAMWLSMMIAGPFFSVYLLEDLKLKYGTIALFAALGQISSMAAMPFWAYLSDKFGHTPVLKLSTAALAVAPFVWIPATSEAYRIIPVAHIYANAVWAGVMLSQLNLLLTVLPAKNDAAYSGLFYGITGLVAAVAPIIGGFIAQPFSEIRVHLGALELRSLHFLFILSACLRGITLIALRPKHTEARTTAATFVLRKVVSSNPFRAFANILAMQLSADEPQRIRATKALGISRTKLALEELADALNDPSPDVRREAARALGEIGDERAVEPLLEKLAMPGEGIVDEAARALGKLGDPRSIGPLLRLAGDPAQDDVVRSRAFLALGDLAAQEAVGPALQALESGSLALAASAATALSRLDEPACIPRIIDRLETADCPVARRQFAEAAARLIGKERQISALFRHDAYVAQSLVERTIRRGLVRLSQESPENVPRSSVRESSQAIAEAYGQQRYDELIEAVLRHAGQARALPAEQQSMAPFAPDETVRRAGVLADALERRLGRPGALEEEAILAVLAFSALTDSLRRSRAGAHKGKADASENSS
jgi:HEAT repeat protein/Na+/melibiose symporter-like transporter